MKYFVVTGDTQRQWGKRNGKYTRSGKESTGNRTVKRVME